MYAINIVILSKFQTHININFRLVTIYIYLKEINFHCSFYKNL